MDAQKKERYQAVQEKIRSACARAGRKPEDVLLLAVSKTKPAQDILDFLALGQKSFAENYVQEAMDKIEKLKDKPIDWHYIGTLQTNKAKFIPGHFSLLHSLDSLRLAQKIDRAAHSRGHAMNCLIEVNISEQLTKGGVPAEEVPALLTSLASLKFIQIKGLMCIPDPMAKAPRKNFAKLRELLEQMNRSGTYPHKLSTLSMGMTADYEDAILEGSTIVRIGTALFGERPVK